jgi:peptidoglycan/LPS O-acetylase OafA/YrhL
MLRGLAILLVLGRHTVAPVEGLGWFEPVAAGWTRIGWSGVDLFFVLSGFLVSGLIFSEYRRTGAVDIRRFVIRRGFKIWPPYLVYVGFVACWLAWKHRHGAGPGVWAQLWPNLFHVQNYFGTPRVHTWSLAVEEHFYLVVALLFYGILSRGRAAALLRRFPPFVAVAVLGLAVVRTFAFLRHGPDDLNIYATHLRFDGLLIGTLLAYVSHFEPEKLRRFARHPVALIVGGLAIAAPTLVLAPEANVWTAGIGLTGVYVGYGLFLLGWLNLPTASRWGGRLFSTRPAAWLGAIGFFSYSIYLWHIDLGQTPMHKAALWAAAHGWKPGVTYAVVTGVYVAIAIVAGRVMARLLEKPSLAIRDRFFPSEVKAVPAALRTE